MPCCLARAPSRTLPVPDLRNRSPILTPVMDQAASRAELRNESRKGRSAKNRRLLVAIGVGVLVVAIVGVLIAVLAGGGGDNGGAAKEATTVPDKSTNVSLQLGKVSAESAGPPAQLTSEQSQAIM